MADVEFEPLHVELEDESEAYFVLGKKKDTPSKKQKPKGGQLFPRKSVEKKDKAVVIDNSTAFSTSPISSKTGPNQHHHHHHHHHPRTVEGLVGPGDIQFGSSPPNYDPDGMMQSSLSQSTGSIPVSVSQSKHVNKPLHLPTRPPPWAQVSQPVPIQQQQRTKSQEKLTLLEQASFTPGCKPKTPAQEGFNMSERLDERRGYQAKQYQSQKTPPRVASPTENTPKIVQSLASSSVEKKFERSGSWGPTSQTDASTKEENWADFSKSFDGGLSVDEEDFETRRRRASQVSTISEGSEGSCVSEIDDGVWKITEEQHHYYVTQFKKLQPNEKGLIKGPQARDFFMKSNLPVEILSKIWHLSDINKDNALDISEFCIAMHLVVAVKHDVELPAVLPAMLTPKQEAQNFNASFSAAPNDMAPQANTRLNGHPEEERPHSPPQSPDDHSWAHFDADGVTRRRDLGKDEDNSQATRPIPSAEDTNHPAQGRLQLEAGADTKTNPLSTVEQERLIDEKSPGHSMNDGSKNTPRIPTETVVQSPALKDSLSKKSSIGIARPRGIGPTINLMDAAPGQLLPPPDSRKSRKMAQQAQPEPSGYMSPPSTPGDARFSNDFTDGIGAMGKDFVLEEHEKPKPQGTGEEVVVKPKNLEQDSTRPVNTQGVEKFDGVDGFEPPKLAPRSANKATDSEKSTSAEASNTNEAAEVFLRRSASVRKGGRPRSYTADSRSSMESLVDVLLHTETKDLAIPPTPPPRKTKTHKRGSSLDLNKLFGAKSQQSLHIMERSDDQDRTNFKDSLPPRIPRVDAAKLTDEKKDKKERGDIQGIARPRPAPKHHRRSTSHDTATALTPLAPPPKTGEGILKDGPSTGLRKKPAPPRPHTAVRNIRSKSLERSSDSTKVEEPLALDKKPRPMRLPSRQKQQRHEIQAEIRLVREKNASIASLNSELHHELREAMESRTRLERKLAKTKQLFE